MRHLYRSASDRVLGGVCGGLGEYLRIDPLVLRILFVVLALTNGMGAMLYLLMWLAIPSAADAGADQERILRRNAREIRVRARSLGGEARRTLSDGWPATDRMFLAGAALVTVGVLVLLRNLGLLVWFGRLWPLALVALGAVLLLNTLKESA